MQKQNSSKVKAIESQKPTFLSDFSLLVKFRLTLLAVFTALMSYLAAAHFTNIHFWDVLMLAVGGFCLSGGASIFNQVLEKDLDKLMQRTQNRPIAADRVSVTNGILLAGGLSLTGGTLLAMLNPITGFLGLLSLVSYAFVYTPMKRSGSVAVAIGAIPGALPATIGVVAFTGTVDGLAIFLFAIQFFWQFPHFWAIAWLADDDYKKAGFFLLPDKNGEKTPMAGKLSFWFSLLILVSGFIAYAYQEIGLVCLIALSLVGLFYAVKSFQFYKKCTTESARALMFASFIYLPIALLAIFFDKMF